MHAAADLLGLIELLNKEGVEFIVVGGVAAVLHGAPVTTFDLDIVYSRDPENLRRLHHALQQLDAIYRIQPERRLVPTPSHLESNGHHLLMTRAGPLDVLGTVGNGHSYDALLGQTEHLEAQDGLTVRVLNLEGLIRLKEEVGREKDKLVLPILRALLRERESSSEP